jgi:hypothetical protein
MRAGYCPHKAISILASGVFAYQKAMDMIITNKQAAISEWQGTKGERIGLDGPMDAECAFLRGYEGSYGAGTIVKLVDKIGNRYTWFASCDFTCLPFDVGDTGIDFIATVKGHTLDSHQGDCKVTLINRPNFVAESIAKIRKRANG